MSRDAGAGAGRRGLAVAALALAFAAAAPAAGSGPNVLFIAIDDLRPELGCYGVAGAQSPRLDRFAAEGILFTRHYVQSATCGASRYALLTGRSPARSGVRGGNFALYRGKTAISAAELPGAQTLPELFRRSGYRTVCLGKISHTPDGRVYEYDGRGDGAPELPHAWDALPTPFGAWGRGWGSFFAYTGGRHREDGKGHRDLMEFTAERDEDLPDGLIAQAAVEQLRDLSRRDEPFFLGVGFFKPHLPFVAPRADWEAVGEAELPSEAARARPENDFRWHASGEFHRYKLPFPKTRPLAEEAQRRTRRAYRACVRYVDRQVGKVLDALDELGLSDKTIVVIWGDHGWHLGEQDIWGKHTPHERALRSVLMIRAPGVTRAGTRSDALVETIDIAPTLIDLCRPRFTRMQHALDGASLRPILAGEADAVRDAALSWWQDAVTARTATHRLIVDERAPGRDAEPAARPERPRVALYDLRGDEDSTRDVAAEEPEIAAALRRRIAARLDPPAEADPFAPDNLVAWCVVPFDAARRGPRERAAMLARLGFTKLAYDWRAEHVEEFEAEILALRERGIEYFAFWDEHESAFALFEKHGIAPQIWKSAPSPEGATPEERVEAAARSLLPILARTRKLGSKLGLYNHGGWGGEPASLVAVCERLRREPDAGHVGIVYNLHHGHERIPTFAADLEAMRPYLICLNLNGMNDRAEPKILAIGKGARDAELLGIIRSSGYRGPIGIIDHRPETDSEMTLRENLEGLRGMVGR